MLKKRLIPVLLLMNGQLVRSELFNIHQIIGNPIHEVERFNEWSVDELIYLDISRESSYSLGRDDKKVKRFDTRTEILDAVSRTCFMPLAWGGRIKSIDDMRECFLHGADKITINSEAVRNKALISEGSKIFGNQAIVVSIDALKTEAGHHEVFIDGGKTSTHMIATEWAKQVEDLGAGEILLQSIDRDGTGRGYDLELINDISNAVTIPVIACSGVGAYEHYADGIEAGAAAVAAANIWHFKEMADRGGKRALDRAKVDIRF